VLLTSSFKINVDMGLLTALSIVFALILDFLFLPALLLFVDKRVDRVGIKNITEGETDMTQTSTAAALPRPATASVNSRSTARRSSPRPRRRKSPR